MPDRAGDEVVEAEAAPRVMPRPTKLRAGAAASAQASKFGSELPSGVVRRQHASEVVGDTWPPVMP